MNIFEKFTNQYSLSKTLRFELKPIGKTQSLLEKNHIFEIDELIQKKYEATKPYFDRLHREFINEALQNAVLTNLEGYFEIFTNWKKDKKEFQKKELQKKEAELRKEIVALFNEQAKKWNQQYIGLKNDTIEVLSEEGVFEYLLEKRYGGEDGTLLIDESTKKEISIFESWKGFIGYFRKYFETRKNFYKDDGTSTAIATRIIDQNLKRFCDNILIFESVKGKVDFAEVEKNFQKALSDIFSLEFYNSCLLQDGIDFYNKILGGETKENGEKIKGLNECINLYRQNTGEGLPFFKMLDKQILSEKDKQTFGIESEEEFLKTLSDFYQNSKTKIEIFKNLFVDFTENFSNYDLDRIYLSKEAFNTISRKWTNETTAWQEALFEVLKEQKLVNSKKKNEEEFSFPDFISLGNLKKSLESEKITEALFWKDRYYKNEEIKNGLFESEEKLNFSQFMLIFKNEFEALFEREIEKENGKKVKIGFNVSRQEIEKLLAQEKIEIGKEEKVNIKEFADDVLKIYQMAKYFALEKKRTWNEDYQTGDFYDKIDVGYLVFYKDAYEQIVGGYNDLRNYLTKKSYSEEKWKLNFENSTLADGWDKNKESDNFAVILRKDGKYFLGIMAKGHNKIFDDRNKERFLQNIEYGKYEKVVYKFFPDQAKMFPKVCFSKKGLKFFKPSDEILNIYKNAEFKKGDNFLVQSMHKLIDFYKDCLTKYEGWKGYNFTHLKPTKDYQENIEEFFRDVVKDGYKITFQDISEYYINEKNQNGELYLFQIKNKDWNEGSGGVKNLHTLYFESLFSAESIAQNFPIKLNGQAEIFYRPKTEVEKLGTKKDKNEKAVVNHKRYSEDKIFFHVPITLNRTKSDPSQFNAKINNFLANNSGVNIIGVDRGEKHLAYFSVITQKGEILDSGSLNFVKGGNNQEINYAEKLEEKAKNREQARKGWQEVEGIKNLKKGYISQVVRKLADLAIRYNAIIVFEDLNMRFKQIRGGIEKSVYQQLEKALIEKLSFLVQKGETDSQKAGHLLRAYQLTAPFTTFKNMGKQTGIIFYTQASYTSKIDPVTGWRPHLYLKYSNAEQAKKEIEKFSKIEFVNDRFEFTYDVRKFQLNKKEYPKNTIWTVCSNVERFRWNKKLNQNKGDYDHYKNLTENFKKLFEDAGVNISGNIFDQIKGLAIKGNEKFFRDFIFFFNLVCQIRNTNKDRKGNENDFILSPVAPFFDSRKDNGKDLPKNGDDNGAYNIARKGIMILKKISDFAKQNGNCEKMKWGDLYISDTEWDNFSQNL